MFGSRARGDYFETSDVGVEILARGEINKSKNTLLRERIENSNIPYEVDVVDLSRASKELTDRVIEEGVIIWRT